jgi:hypothetical protein
MKYWTDTCYNMDEPCNYAIWKKPDTKSHTVRLKLCEISQTGNSQRQKTVVVTRAWWERKIRIRCSVDGGGSFWGWWKYFGRLEVWYLPRKLKALSSNPSCIKKRKTVSELNRGAGCTALWMSKFKRFILWDVNFTSIKKESIWQIWYKNLSLKAKGLNIYVYIYCDNIIWKEQVHILQHSEGKRFQGKSKELELEKVTSWRRHKNSDLECQHRFKYRMQNESWLQTNEDSVTSGLFQHTFLHSVLHTRLNKCFLSAYRVSGMTLGGVSQGQWWCLCVNKGAQAPAVCSLFLVLLLFNVQWKWREQAPALLWLNISLFLREMFFVVFFNVLY